MILLLVKIFLIIVKLPDYEFTKDFKDAKIMIQFALSG